MGFIYSQAEEVVVSLDSSTGVVLRHMSGDTDIQDEMLEILEQDAWVESVWTYQEVVNGRGLKFVPRYQLGEHQGDDTIMIPGLRFFSCLGTSLQHYKKRHGIKDLGIFQRFPRLDALEETLSDWTMADYVERSALQIMANMDRRRAVETKYRFYSMIGSVTKDPCQRKPAITLSDLSDIFMQLCEQKDDFSFIFSSAPRNQSLKRWKPQAGFLPSVISWHCSGSAQTGCYDESGFWLKSMMCLHPESRVGEHGLHFLLSCVRTLGRSMTEDSHEAIAEGLLHILYQMGYTGEASGIPTYYGLFYPQHPVHLSESVDILVSTQVRWTFGAPSLAKILTPEGPKFVPGVFAGVVLQEGPEVHDYLIGPGEKWAGHSKL